MGACKISVIVPVYKVEPYLRRCVDSILGQTFTDFELILVDDGSPDNCPAICDEYAKKDSRVRVIHQENGGLSAARNAGIDWAFVNSGSQWLNFIDSDDWVHERYLEALYDAVTRTACRISVCAYKETGGEVPAVDEATLVPAVWKTEPFYVKNYVNATVAWGKLYRKELFQGIRYPVGKLNEDEFATYQILFPEETVAYINQPLYFYFQNQGSIMHSTWSERKMVAYDARDEQIAYFLQNGYPAAVRLAARNYLLGVHEGLAREKKASPQNKRAIQLYLERKKKFSGYIRMLDIGDPKDQYVLAQIRPIRTRIRLYARAICRKMRKT